jgi:pyruvate dehydrogenase E2 component (dihydrolipoamide acetyltransferase)
MPDVLMPRLSDTMEGGVLSQWRKHQSDPVSKGDVLAEIETDKATMELEADDEGTLTRILVAEAPPSPSAHPSPSSAPPPTHRPLRPHRRRPPNPLPVRPKNAPHVQIPPSRPTPRPHRRTPPSARPRWPARSPASTVWTSPRYPAPARADASCAPTSKPPSPAKPPPRNHQHRRPALRGHPRRLRRHNPQPRRHLPPARTWRRYH